MKEKLIKHCNIVFVPPTGIVHLESHLWENKGWCIVFAVKDNIDETFFVIMNNFVIRGQCTFVKNISNYKSESYLYFSNFNKMYSFVTKLSLDDFYKYIKLSEESSVKY